MVNEVMADSRKEERKIRKRKKAMAEFELAKSNDAAKRSGELLDSPNVKKFKVDSSEPLSLNDADFKELKQQLRERKKLLTQIPRFYLQNAGIQAALTVPYKDRVPILMSDIQQLLIYALCGNSVICPPERWCNLQKNNRLTHIVALVVEGISSADFFAYEHLLPNITKGFTDRVEVLPPCHYGREVSRELSCVPLSVKQKESILEKYGTMEAALSSKEIFKVFRSLFPIEINGTEITVKEDGQEFKLPAEDMFPRTYLALNLHQLIMENFPLPFPADVSTKYKSYKMTKSEYKHVTPHSPIFAIDCEMCITTERHELTRIAIVNEDLKVVYESLVKPKNPIVNYLTRFSGITEELLKDVTTTLEDVQTAVQDIIPANAILAGHSLNCDLEAMEMIHPYIIDTSIIFNMDRAKRKQKLSALAEHFLGEQIQCGNNGHSPIEDATATMKLVKLKLSKGYRFGDAATAEVKGQNPMLPECQLTTSIFNKAAKAKKTVAVIAPQATIDVYKSFSFGGESKDTEFITVPRKGYKETITRLQNAFIDYNFAMAHLDLTAKLKKMTEDTKSTEMELLMTKVDKWCDKVLNGISVNGMCVVLFAGPSEIKSIATMDDSKNVNPSDPDPSDSSIQNPIENGVDNVSPQLNSSKPGNSIPTTRRNGVCFVRINQAKVN